MYDSYMYMIEEGLNQGISVRFSNRCGIVYKKYKNKIIYNKLFLEFEIKNV